MENIYNGCPTDAAVEASYDRARSLALRLIISNPSARPAIQLAV